MISYDDFDEFDEEEFDDEEFDDEEAEGSLFSKTLDVEYVFGFSSYESGYDYAEAELSEGLYDAIKEYYLESGEDEINCMLEDDEFPEEFKPELQEMFDTLKDDLIEVQQENGDGCDPEAGEEYNWDEAYVRIIIEPPPEWENDD